MSLFSQSSSSKALDNRSVANAAGSAALGGASGAIGIYRSGVKNFGDNNWPVAAAVILAALVLSRAIFLGRRKRKR